MSSEPNPYAPRLSQRFATLLRSTEHETVTLEGVFRSLDERGHALLILFLVVPFLQPIPLPMLSTPFGLAIAALGLQMTLHKPPWLPAGLGRRPLPTALVARVCEAAQKLLQRFEHLIKPRGQFFHAHPSMRRVAGVVIGISGLLLSLPLPIPVSNFLPALTIALVALGSLEEDGWVVLLGYAAFVVTCAFFVGIVLLPVLGIRLFT